MTLKEIILQIAAEKPQFQASDILRRTGGEISRQYVHRVVTLLIRGGELIKGGAGRYTFYALPGNEVFLTHEAFRELETKDLQEHEVLADLERSAPFILRLKDSVRSILTFGFSEMLNNAIDHSQSKKVRITLAETDDGPFFEVRDAGVGVFRNIMQKRGLASELEAVQDLLKGKLTTQPQAHSGEGIFFTSKSADIFILESYGLRLRVDNLIQDVFVEEIRPIKGTRVRFKISGNSRRHLNDIFRRYQTDPEEYAFDKTEVQIRLYTMGTVYVSRSQARRVLTGLEKFKVVTLDFDRVPTVGQAFADEIFRVFQSKYPGITIIPVNMNGAVEFMVGRVEKP